MIRHCTASRCYQVVDKSLSMRGVWLVALYFTLFYTSLCSLFIHCHYCNGGRLLACLYLDTGGWLTSILQSGPSDCRCSCVCPSHSDRLGMRGDVLTACRCIIFGAASLLVLVLALPSHRESIGSRCEPDDRRRLGRRPGTTTMRSFVGWLRTLALSLTMLTDRLPD
jgi:hypothetical protein